MLQLRRSASAAPAAGDAVLDTAARGVSDVGAALPHRTAIQDSFGPAHDVSGMIAHVGGAAADAADAIGAEAYATGSHVAFRSAPDLHTAAHEAAHVVQQQQGVQLYGGVGEAGDAHERQADAVADRVVAGRSAADLLGAPGAQVGQAVQRKDIVDDQRDKASDASVAAVDAHAYLIARRIDVGVDVARVDFEQPYDEAIGADTFAMWAMDGLLDTFDAILPDLADLQFGLGRYGNLAFDGVVELDAAVQRAGALVAEIGDAEVSAKFKRVTVRLTHVIKKSGMRSGHAHGEEDPKHAGTSEATLLERALVTNLEAMRASAVLARSTMSTATEAELELHLETVSRHGASVQALLADVKKPKKWRKKVKPATSEAAAMYDELEASRPELLDNDFYQGGAVRNGQIRSTVGLDRKK